jgi:hypothetical protein
MLNGFNHNPNGFIQCPGTVTVNSVPRPLR